MSYWYINDTEKSNILYTNNDMVSRINDATLLEHFCRF